MATSRNPKSKHTTGGSPFLLVATAAVAVGLIWILLSSTSVLRFPFPLFGAAPKASEKDASSGLERRYLYWGSRIDCPGKHCYFCEGLGHQESSLRCALEEALLLKRVFVMPSRMCINPIHNKKGILHHLNATSDERWAAGSCAISSLYDLDLISKTIPVILDNSKMWCGVLSTSMKLGKRGLALVEGTSRVDLKYNSFYSDVLLINRSASSLSWFMECKDRTDHSSVLLPYSFLPMSAAPKLRDAANKKWNSEADGGLATFEQLEFTRTKN